MSIAAKIWHLTCRAGKQTLCLPRDIRYYGWKVAVYIWRDRVLLGMGKEKYISVVQGFMDGYLAELAETYRQQEMVLPENPRVDRVWCCWWQGEAQMPELVRMTTASIRAALPQGVTFQLLTKDNYLKFVDIPQPIIEKHEKGLIGSAHYSDILRFALLKKYGGFWIDSTVLVTKTIPSCWFSSAYYTQRFSSPEECPGEPCFGKWAGFLQCGVREYPLFSFVYEALIRWWNDHDQVIDYVMFDYIIMTAYGTVPQIQQLIDAVPANNENIWSMEKLLSQPFDQTAYDELCATQYFHKLAWSLKPEKDGTFYGHLCEKYLK